MMKKLILINLLLAFVSCSQLNGLEDSSYSFSENASTRSGNTDEIANSPLLNDLRTYNDSLINEAAQETSTSAIIITPQMQRITQIAVADFLGYQAGYQMVKTEGGNDDEAHIIGTMMSSKSSQNAARKVVSMHGGSIPNLPPSTGEPLKKYENLYSAVINNPNYLSLSVQEIQLLGTLSMLNGQLDYFKAGIDHNLLIKKYGVGLSSSDIVTNMLNQNTNNIIYSEEFQSKISEEIDYIVEGNIDYNYFFSKHNHGNYISVSQVKAAEITRLYVELLVTTYPSFEEHKSILYQYMTAIESSLEISGTERKILLNSLPIALTSKGLWKSLYNLNPTI